MCMRSARFISIAVSLFVVAPAVAFAVTVHPIWGPVIVPGSVNSTSPPPNRYLTLPLSQEQQSTRSSVMKDRVCRRVKNRFSDDTTVMGRINNRLQNRFGFTCNVVVVDPGGSDGGGIDVIDDGAILTVSKHSFGSVGDEAPKGSQNIPMLKIDMTANCVRDITVESVLVSDHAPGLASDVSGIWISIDSSRISRTRGLSNDRTSLIRFQRPFVIGACRTETIEFYMMFSETALSGSKHQFFINSPEDFFSDARIELAETPIGGERFSVSPFKTGKISVSYLPVEQDVIIDAGDRQIVGKFSVSIDDSEDQTFEWVTLENTGRSHDGDLAGIYLRGAHGRARFTELAPLTVDDHVTLFFDPPYPLLEGRSIDFEVIADGVSGTGTSVQLQFEETSDIFGVGSLSGFGRNGQKYGAHVEIEGTPSSVKMR